MSRLPSLFISHGAPTFALEPGQAGPQLTALGGALPRPEAVLVVSPHWMTPGPRVGSTARPQTIHDFGGFDPALYRIEYPAPGHPRLAHKAVETLNASGWPAHADEKRGLDHGAWVPMLHLFPQAEVPVFQVSLPSRLDAASAWVFGEALAPLAEGGVLIVGSGTASSSPVARSSRADADSATSRPVVGPPRMRAGVTGRLDRPVSRRIASCGVGCSVEAACVPGNPVTCHDCTTRVWGSLWGFQGPGQKIRRHDGHLASHSKFRCKTWSSPAASVAVPRRRRAFGLLIDQASRASMSVPA